MRVHAKLIINVTYDDAESTDQAKNVLNSAAEHLASNGLLSNDNGPMVVDTWDATAVAVEER